MKKFIVIIIFFLTHYSSANFNELDYYFTPNGGIKKLIFRFDGTSTEPSISYTVPITSELNNAFSKKLSGCIVEINNNFTGSEITQKILLEILNKLGEIGVLLVTNSLKDPRLNQFSALLQRLKPLGH